MFTVDQIEKAVGHTALITGIDTVPKGHIRIETGFLYPDGSSIDVFLQQETGFPEFAMPKLTDFGNTWSWLQNLEMKPNRSPAQKLYFSRILELYRCTFEGAAIEHRIESLDNISTGIIQIGQACLRTADLVYSKRFRPQSDFNQSVEEVIADTSLEYDTSAEISLRNGNVVKVDFKIYGTKLETAVQTLASGNSYYAHHKAVEINARWDDLRELSDWTETKGQCLTVFDDSSAVYDNKDLSRLERKSVLLPISDTEAINSILKAA